MAENKPFSIWLLLLSGLSMVAGMGLLLFELVNGLLYRSLPTFLLWGLYLVLLLISVWGMKTWLELQAETFAGIRRFFNSLFYRYGKPPQSYNLFRLPAEGQIYVFMLTIMLLGALFGKTNTLMLIFALMAGPFIVNGGITFSMTRRLVMNRRLPERIMQGEPTSVDITVTNNKRLVASNLISVEDRIEGPRELLTGKLMFALIPARTSRQGRYQVRFMQRGRYRFGPVRITSRFPLGIVERGQQIEVLDELLVYPQIGFLAAWWLRRLTDGQEASRHAQGQTGSYQDEFHRIREYRQGDELRSIHWKTSARRNELMVREYRQNRDRRLLILLDLWEPADIASLSESQQTGWQTKTEHAVSLAATLGWSYLKECGSRQLDFLCFGNHRQQWLGNQREDRPETLLDELAVAEASPRYALADLEAEVQARQSGNTRCVLITTRQQKDFFTDSAAHEHASTWHGLMIIEATPEQTAEFFQLEVLE